MSRTGKAAMARLRLGQVRTRKMDTDRITSDNEDGGDKELQKRTGDEEVGVPWPRMAAG